MIVRQYRASIDPERFISLAVDCRFPMTFENAVGPPKASINSATVLGESESMPQLTENLSTMSTGFLFIPCAESLFMGDSNDRLRSARDTAKFKSARGAAIKFGWTPSTYASHENGQTPVPIEAAKTYGKAFGVRPEWILTGELPREAKIGKFRAVQAAAIEDFDEAEPVLIRSGGRLLIVEEAQPPQKLIGQECAVRLPDGRLLVRVVRPGSTRRVFNLEAPGSTPLTDQPIEWAARVRQRA